MKVHNQVVKCITISALLLAGLLVVVPAGADSTTTTTPTYYYAWDNDGHTYVSTQSQAVATAAAVAWNKKNTYTASWSGFVVYGTCPNNGPTTPNCPILSSAEQQIIDIKGEAAAGTFWLATSSSGAVFTSTVSQADVQAKAAADLNPAPTPAYTAMSSVGITYTSAVSQANANAMATFVEHTAVPEWVSPGPNGMLFSSPVSYADAVAQGLAFQEANMYAAAAGDYIGYDAETSTGFSNPADIIFFIGPTQAAVDATAKAWGTRLVRGGVYLASNLYGTWIYVGTSTAGAKALATGYPYPSNPTALTATSVTGEKFYGVNAEPQQWVDNAAAYSYQKSRVLPTSPETCYQGSKSNTLTLLSWQCPAHWSLLTPAKTSKAALAAAAAARARLRTLTCVDLTYGGDAHITAEKPTCPTGTKAVVNTVVCVRGKITRRVTELAAKCPVGYRQKK
jgi:hypothetical protein